MHVMSGEALEAQIGGLLVGLAAKGTTVEGARGRRRHAGEGGRGVVRGRLRRARHLRDRGGRAGDVQHLDGGGAVVAAAGGVAQAAKHF